MPFGLRNAAQTFQRLMDHILRDLPFVFVYLDDILVASPDFSSHLSHLTAVLDLLKANGLLVNLNKCVFAQSSLSFLGHTITAAGITPLSSHVDAVRDYLPPSSLKDLRRFLSLVNFYRCFVPHAAAILRPLTDALAGNPRSLTWTPDMRAAFRDIKSALASATLLIHPHPTAPISLTTDASDSHIGAVLQQQVQGAWQPLSFFTAKLTPPQQPYTTFDCELQAVYSSLLHYRYFLEGRPFTLFTDHQPLVSALTRSSIPKSARQQRQLAFLSEFHLTICHTAGVSNVVADALSQPPPPLSLTPTAAAILPVTPPFSPLHLAQQQAHCSEVQALWSSSTLCIQTHMLGDTPLLGDASTPIFRPLVPQSLRHALFQHVHGLAHPGIRATRRLLSTRYVWPHLAKDVSYYFVHVESQIFKQNIT